jgi:hypothetical protein
VVLALAAAPAAIARVSHADGPARPALQVEIDKSKVDLKEHHLELKASRALVKVTL